MKSAGGRGHASDGGANAALRLAILVDPILPRCPCMCVEGGVHMRSSNRLLGASFCPSQWDMNQGGRGLFIERSVLWAAMAEEDNNAVRQQRDFPKISSKGPMNHLRIGQILGHAHQRAHPHRSHKVRQRNSIHSGLECSIGTEPFGFTAHVDEEGLAQRFGDSHKP